LLLLSDAPLNRSQTSALLIACAAYANADFAELEFADDSSACVITKAGDKLGVSAGCCITDDCSEALAARVTATEALVQSNHAALRTMLDAANAKIDSLQTTVNDLGSNHTALHARLTATESSQTLTETNVAALTTAVAAAAPTKAPTEAPTACGEITTFAIPGCETAAGCHGRSAAATLAANAVAAGWVGADSGSPASKAAAIASARASHLAEENACASHGCQLPSYSQICPGGQGSNPAGHACTDGQSWTAYDDSEDSWVSVSCKAGSLPACSDHIQSTKSSTYDGIPEWARGDIYGKLLYCWCPCPPTPSPTEAPTSPPTPASLEPVAWTNAVNANAGTPGYLQKTGGGDVADGGAISTQDLDSSDQPQGVMFKCSVSGRKGSSSIAGLGHDGPGTSQTPTQWYRNLAHTGLDYGIQCHQTHVGVYENGAYKGTYLSGSYNMADDMLEVRVTGTTVTYLRNGVVFYSSATAPTFPLHVDTVLVNNGDVLRSVGIYAATE
jgi:hypothetical protein